MAPTFLGLAAGTLVSEDLTCILAGVLIYQGRLDPLVGMGACSLGIYLGDLGLYFVGRLFATRALRWRAVRRYLTPSRHARFHDWFSQHAAALILGSRFLPGTRLPLYLAAGALGGSFARFAVWSFVAVAIWVPVLVLASAHIGGVAVSPVARLAGVDWSARVAAAVLLLAVWRLILQLTTRRGRQRVAASVSRMWRWEFWPMWLFYAPVAAWIAGLAIRHRGIGVLSAANPGMPDGGIVGESKNEILSHLPTRWTIPSDVVSPGTPDARMRQFLDIVARSGWAFPLVFKPDVGQRGTGVKIVRTSDDVSAYLARERHAVLVQPYHPGPFEAGVFYYRMPGWSRGRILSITDKHFPVVVGDGRSTLEDLIWADRRLRMQAWTFLSRHADGRYRVLAAGERLPLAIAGNHAQGTLFRDGRHLITPALEERIDGIASLYEGFYIGRFDIRYGDVDRFKAGEDLAIVELNGATAESTNIYDPAASLVSAYRQLFRQWSLVFAIAAANQRSGAPSGSAGRVIELLRAHLTAEVAFETSD